MAQDMHYYRYIHSFIHPFDIPKSIQSLPYYIYVRSLAGVFRQSNVQTMDPSLKELTNRFKRHLKKKKKSEVQENYFHIKCFQEPNV